MHTLVTTVFTSRGTEKCSATQQDSSPRIGSHAVVCSVSPTSDRVARNLACSMNAGARISVF